MDNLKITYPFVFPLLYHKRIIGMFVINGDDTRYVIYDDGVKPSMKLKPLDHQLLMRLPLGHQNHPFTTDMLIRQIGMAAFGKNTKAKPERQVRDSQMRLTLKRGVFIGGNRKQDGSQGIYIAITPEEARESIEPYGKQAKTMMKRYEEMKKLIRTEYNKGDARVEQ